MSSELPVATYSDAGYGMGEHVSRLDSLLSDPTAFPFLAAIRMIRLALKAQGIDLSPTAPWRDVRFGASTRIGFPAGEIAALTTRPGESEARFELIVNFIGLTGPQGTLPHHYSVEINQATPKNRAAATAFLDLFNDRVVSLFWQAWRCGTPELALEDERTSAFECLLLALCGLDPGSIDSQAVDPHLVTYFAGALARRPVAWTTVEQLLAHKVGAAVELHQWIGEWSAIPESLRTALGARNCELGESLVLGDSHFNRAATVELRIGPLAPERFGELLPGSNLHREVSGLCRLMLGPTLRVRIRLVRPSDGIEKPEGDGAFVLNAGSGMRRLGLDTWIATVNRRPLLDDCVFQTLRD